MCNAIDVPKGDHVIHPTWQRGELQIIAAPAGTQDREVQGTGCSSQTTCLAEPQFVPLLKNNKVSSLVSNYEHTLPCFH